MSGGWIKSEKDLRHDVRTKRMAAAIAKLEGNAPSLHYETLVLGGLQQFWMHADSFARDDDTLEITLDEINQLTGIEGFAQAMPADWLEVLDENTVKLPGFHAHNGTDAKRKALTAKRVARHRDKVKRSDVVSRNAHALPDQTRPDQTNKEGAAAPLVLHESLPKQHWAEWLSHRRKRKWPVDPVTLGKQLKVLATLGTPEQIAVIETSIQAGWQGLFAPKGAPKPAAVKTSEPLTPEQQAAYRRRMDAADRDRAQQFAQPATNVGAKTA